MRMRLKTHLFIIPNCISITQATIWKPMNELNVTLYRRILFQSVTKFLFSLKTDNKNRYYMKTYRRFCPHFERNSLNINKNAVLET